jgi:hypothetical protein
MSVTPGNLVQGPATLYFGLFGATEPADTAIDTAPSDTYWTDFGATIDGVDLEIDQKYSQIEVDQVVDPVESRLVSRQVKVTTKVAEATLDNLQVLLNGGTAGSGAGYESLTFDDTGAGERPTYYALIIDGYGPLGDRRRVIVRKVVQTDSVKLENKKDDPQTFALSMLAHYISASVKPIHIVDSTANGS